MSQNLKARLSRIRNTSKSPPLIDDIISDEISDEKTFDKNTWPGWEREGNFVYKRKLFRKLPHFIPSSFSSSLSLLLPDLIPFCKNNSDILIHIEDLLFFDIETTGLSGGAGTIAFLAAFGRFAKEGIHITQYLLLDYPGENCFLEEALKEFESSNNGSNFPILVTYNGKCFDTQILKSRCFMNGFEPPSFNHADLLHSARRLWKKLLPDCSQGTIEERVLGLDRSGDIPGAFAPEIWFSFLKTNENADLLKICDHNVLDISGLSCLFLAMAEIADDPFMAIKNIPYDTEALAILFYRNFRKNPTLYNEEEKGIMELLMERAARNSFLPAAIILAIEAEWSLHNYDLALQYTEYALMGSSLTESQMEELGKRKKRLLGKMERNS